MRLLVIEDDERIRAFTCNGLRQEGHVVDDAAFGNDGLTLWNNTAYDAVILDIGLPEQDGLTILRTMRRKGDATPVIIISAKKAVDERIDGLMSGADDYMTKPFALSELSARLLVITRRRNAAHTAAQLPSDGLLSVSGVTLDLATRCATREGKALSLKPKEFALLEFMMRNANRVLTKEVILKQVWDYRFDPQSNIVDALICRLRNKIDAPFNTHLIETRKGLGYVFTAQR